MQTMNHEATVTPKARKRTVTKSPKVKAVERLTGYVTERQMRLFATHALYLGMDKSEYLQHLIDTNCNRFVVSDRTRPVAVSPDQGKSDASATQEVSVN